MERSENDGHVMPRRARLLKALDLAATVLSLVGGVAVIFLSVAMYRRQYPESPAEKIPSEPVSIASATLRGSQAAPLVLVVFSDFQCPFCRDFTHDVLPQVVEKFVTTGKVRLAFIEFPLMSIHPLAKKAALQAVCAGKQGRYWQMHEQLFQPPQLTERDMERFPAAIGLDTNAYQQCMNDPATTAKVAQDHALSRSLSIPGTPTFYVGRPVAPDSVRVLRRFAQAKTFDQIAAQLEAGMEANVKRP
jgi:protein-disulfide isomerase